MEAEEDREQEMLENQKSPMVHRNLRICFPKGRALLLRHGVK